MQNGLDLPPPSAAAPSPAPQPASAEPAVDSAVATTGGSTGLSVGVVVGVTLGCSAAVILAAGLLYWFVLRPRMRSGAVTDAMAAQAKVSAKSNEHSSSDASSQVRGRWAGMGRHCGRQGRLDSCG